MILLDTHTVLWFLNDDDNLPQSIRDLIEDETEVFVSIVLFVKLLSRTVSASYS